MTDEARMQRIEDKLDKLTEVVIDTRVMQQEMLALTKRQDEQEQVGKDRDKEVEALRGDVLKLRDRQNTMIKIGGVLAFAFISVMTGINFL